MPGQLDLKIRKSEGAGTAAAGQEIVPESANQHVISGSTITFIPAIRDNRLTYLAG